jgi:hypothetical protein
MRGVLPYRAPTGKGSKGRLDPFAEPSAKDRCLRIPAVARRTYRSASRSGICIFPLLNGGREPQRGSAHAADLSPGSDKP